MPGLDALSKKKKKVRHFQTGGTTGDPIAALYDAVFDRAPDPGGYEYWSNALASGTSLADIESAFRASPEYQSMGSSGGGGSTGTVTVTGADQSFDDSSTPTSTSTAGLADWYQQNLGRQADVGGLNYWSGQFGATLDPNEIEQLKASDEYKNRQALTNLYDVELGRKPDETGFNFWMDALGSGTSFEDVKKTFTGAPEAQIYDLYQQGVGRKPDEAGAAYWGDLLKSGVPFEELQRQVGATSEGQNYSINRLYEQELGRKADEPGFEYYLKQLQSGVPIEKIRAEISGSTEGTIYDLYENILGRKPDVEGAKNWADLLKAGTPLEEIARQISLSDESRGLRAGELAGLFTTQFGTDFVNSLTEDEMKRFTEIFSDVGAKQQYTAPVSESVFDREFYLQNNPDVARLGLDPYQHYLEYGFNEGRAPNATGPSAMTASQRYQEVMKQAALDPELGAIIKAKNPFLFESLTPLTNDPNQQKTTERIRYGQYGTYNVDGVEIPILNAKVADQILGRDQFGSVTDFSHGRGRALSELGWTGNSFSNKIARGAEAIGATANTYFDGDGNPITYYSGLEDAAKLVGVDPNQFQDKQVQATQKADIYNEYGQLIAKAGEPIFETDQYGRQIPVMETVNRDQQLYDAINQAAKDIYLYTGDSLTPGKATEGGGQSFDTVLYKRSGDELIPLTKPTSHGGYQNLDVYTGGSGFNFGRDIAPGLIFVGGAALAWTGAGTLAASLGNTLAGAVGATVSQGTASIIGGVAIGAATGALTAAATGSDIGQGALKGGVAGGVGASMPQVLNSIPGMDSMVNSIASTLNFNPADVGSVISSTLSRTLATAAAGANGDQILKSFTTALASSSLGAAAANGVESVMKGSFTDEQIAGMARATQLVTNAATTSIMSGANAQQVAGSVINSLVQGAGSIKQAVDQASVDQATTPFGTENVGLTTGAVDAVLQEPIFRQDILDNASDPIAAMNAMNNWTGDQRSNMQYLATDLINQGMPRQELVDSFKSVFRMDEPSANAFIQETAARAAITELANKSDDPIAMFNAGAMLTGDKKQNVDLVVKEMLNQGLSKPEISKNLQDIFRVPEDKADAYATQITKDQPFTSKATTFGEAFKEARSAGVKEFEYDGKRFNTNLASDKVEQIATREAQTGTLPQDAGRAPSWSGLIKSTAPVSGLKSAVDQPMESTPFGPMTTSRAPSFMGQAQSIATRAATQQEVNNYLAQNNPPVAIDPQNKTVVQSIADFYKDSLLGTAGQYIESLGNLRTYLSQVAVAHGIISPDNSFVVSSKAMQQVGEAIIPPALKESQANIVRSIDQAETVPGKIVSGIVSAIENPRGASLFVGGALVEAGFSLGVGAAATAFTGLASTGIATASLIQGAQSFGAKYDQLIQAGVDPDKAMLPSYVSGLITTVTSGIANVPIFKAFTGPATSVGTSASRDLVLRNITGEGAERIVQASIPVFVAAGVTRDFATEYMDELLGGMSTEYILEGTITPSRYQTEAVLAGLIDVGANAAVRMPFEFANRVGVETDTTRQTPEQELKEYTVPLLEYKPSTAPAQLGYTPTISPENAVNSVVETRNNSAQQLFDNLDITPEEAIDASTKGIGATVIESINAESTNKSTQIDPGALIVEDAFGNPITYADAIGAIVTESPIIDLSVGTKEQQMTNADLLQSVFETLNIDPRNAMVAQTQMQPDVLPRETELAFKERPDIRNLFNVKTLFPEAEVKPVTDIQLSNQVDTNVANDLATKVDTGTATATDLALANDLAVKIETQLQQATDVATKQSLANDLQTVTELINKINLAVQTPTDIAVQPPADVQPPVDIDINVPPGVTVQTPKQIAEEKKRRARRRTPQAQRALQLIDLESGIFDLGPAFTRARTDYTLAGQFASGGKVALPFYDKIAPRYDVFGMAMDPNTGGQGILGGGAIFDPKSPFVGSNIRMPKLTVGTTKKNLNYELAGYPNLARTALNYAEGGAVPEGHNPQFFSEGGLNSLENRYVNGEGDGTSDSVPAMLANGEFVIPADVVSSLGNGSNEAGANVLDEFLQVIREHKQKHDAKQLPPDSKGALAYLLDAKKRA